MCRTPTILLTPQQEQTLTKIRAQTHVADAYFTNEGHTLVTEYHNPKLGPRHESWEWLHQRAGKFT